MYFLPLLTMNYLTALVFFFSFCGLGANARVQSCTHDCLKNCNLNVDFAQIFKATVKCYLDTAVKRFKLN